MAGYTVFYSWQSDLPRKMTRDFIREAASDAVRRIIAGAILEDAPRLDHDTQGVSGAPSIAGTIFDKIDHSGVFLADVTIVGKTIDSTREVKYLPNANVLVELGYAAARIGWPRIVLVMNTAYGLPERLPFDLRYRRFPFCFDTGAHPGHALAAKKQQLAEELQQAILMVAQNEHRLVTEIVAKLDGYCRKLMRERAATQGFYETKMDSFGIVNQLKLVIMRLLELGVIECVTQVNGDHAYVWTYIGRLCLERLGLPQPPVEPYPVNQLFSGNVSVDTHAYDLLEDGSSTADGDD
jgi:hypothetical protein